MGIPAQLPPLGAEGGGFGKPGADEFATEFRALAMTPIGRSSLR